jgi:hypothetical protein
MPHMTKTNMTKANATHATKAKETKAKAIKSVLGKRSYAAKMLRKYERIVDKRNRDKGILLDRKFKDWTLEIEVI